MGAIMADWITKFKGDYKLNFSLLEYSMYYRV